MCIVCIAYTSMGWAEITLALIRDRGRQFDQLNRLSALLACFVNTWIPSSQRKFLIEIEYTMRRGSDGPLMGKNVVRIAMTKAARK